MTSKAAFSSSIFSALMLVALAVGPSMGSPSKPMPAKLKALRDQGLVSSKLGSDADGAFDIGGLPFNDKFALSGAAVRGRIQEIRYLYKEGGPFRTEYVLAAAESWKGKLKGAVSVLSVFGPNSRDHSRWRRDPSSIRLEVGDEGVFLLVRDPLDSLAAQYPDHADFLAGKYMFLENMSGVYLSKNGEMDERFLAASRKPEKALKLKECRASADKINSILEQE